MALSRPRSKSHGQSSASTFQQTSAPRFFPPSHFAAAAGLPKPARSPYSRSRLSDSDELSNVVLPSVMPRFPASSSSSSADAAPGSTSSSLYLLTRKLSISRTASDHGVAPGPRSVKKSNSQKLKDLPTLETHLIPSLRDTIGRMTSHSPTTTFTGSSHQTNLLPPKSSFPPPSATFPAAPGPVMSARSPRSAPATASAIMESSRIRPPATTIPRPIHPAAPPALKPSLKSPASAMSASTATSPAMAHDIKSSSKTVRSAKSFIGRRAVAEQNPSLAPAHRLHERSRTDPGTDPSSVSARKAQHFKPSHSPQFHIPTLHAALNTSSTSENEWAAPPRKLVVANAVIIPSSSSELEAAHARPASKRRSNIPFEPTSALLRQRVQTSRASIGLGFSGSISPHDLGVLPRRQSTSETDDSESAYEDDGEIGEGHMSTSPPATSAPREIRAPVSLQRSTTTENTSFEQQRTKTLSALVDVLDLPQSQHTTQHESFDSEYIGQTGLAISPSTNFESEQAGSSECTRSSSLRISGSGRESVAIGDSSICHRTMCSEGKYSPRTSAPPSRFSFVDASARSFSPTPTEHSSQFQAAKPKSLIPRRQRPESTSSKSHRTFPAADSPVIRLSISTRASPREHMRKHLPASRAHDGDERFVSEAYDLRDTLRQVSAQSRAAFGLPPSPELRPTESMSSVGSAGRWIPDADELSTGAEAIFERFQEAAIPQSQSWVEDDLHAAVNVHSATSQGGFPPSTYAPTHVTDELDRSLDVNETCRNGTWRETLRKSTYRALLEQYGEMEMRRQEAIWGLSEEETIFVGRLRTTVSLFVRPLRIKDTKLWIDGVPALIARSFDWFEDLVNLHSQFLSALNAALQAQYPIILRIAEALRAFVPRFEMYQPYVVRVEQVAHTIQDMARDAESDFGEFVRIQEGAAECEGWSLDKLLAEPVNRLVEYPTHFRRLLELTPREHADYLATYSLLHSFELVIRTLREVKVREEEHDLVHDVLSRIEGLPPSLATARRERRLLARGRLLRASSASPETPFFTLNRSSRLFDAVRARRSPSTSSSDSAFTASSSSTPLTPVSHQSANPTEALHAFVFSDLALLAVPAPATDVKARWRLLDDIGAARVLDVHLADATIALDLLPLNGEPLRAVRLELVVLRTSSAGAHLDTHDVARKWTRAFKRSARHTRRLLAAPSALALTATLPLLPPLSLRLPLPFPLAGQPPVANDVYALLAAGLPLPKSPSAQFADAVRGRAGDTVQGEREERGWWAIRFRDVLREVLGAGEAVTGADVDVGFGAGAVAGWAASTSGLCSEMMSFDGTTMASRAVPPAREANGFDTGASASGWRPLRLASLESAESLAFDDTEPLSVDTLGLGLEVENKL